MNDIDALRAHLFETIDGLRDGSMSVEKAKAIGDIVQIAINSAKVEVDYLRTVNGRSKFLGGIEEKPQLPDGIVGIRQHRIAG